MDAFAITKYTICCSAIKVTLQERPLKIRPISKVCNVRERSGLSSFVTRPVITPWDHDYKMHCCMQAFTVQDCRRIMSARYDSDYWHYLLVLGLKCDFEKGIVLVHQCLSCSVHFNVNLTVV